ncbi:aldehyde dehydrogenase family protein [Carboxydochorda subterranea]|uniref:Aldehyde dehydrogenase family protein n=1 Tax=Carboxydichorda subterranea TaxID=3109565 RepID=A0ABZ1BVS7_9FIRM|nr:aldehyde dehydrogenase family protein [Limnochorda sp. L945t]WRP16879.1 aldehyde dehydrogenase family protein [Limnochorda sp. L945t]
MAVAPAQEESRRYDLWIGGEWVAPASGQHFESVDPATGHVLAYLARGGKADVDRAVAAARAALEGPGWKRIEPRRRVEWLYEAARRIRQRSDSLARLESLDTGKPLRQARTDVAVAARYFEYYAGIADKILGHTIPLGPGFLDYVLREPVGVCALIIPWNYPIQIASRGLAPALAAGNTVVLKPAEEASLTTLELAGILHEVGVPAGVVNVVTGYGEEAGAALASHPDVDHITFTGSVETGSIVMQAAARGIKPVLLELGGKSPMIVMGDADLDRAIPATAQAIFQNAGQTCSAASRLIVDRRVHREAVEALQRIVSQMRLGPGVEDPDMGPIISRRQQQRVLGYVEAGRSEGARLVAGGRVPEQPELSGGYFVEPTLFDEVSPIMRIAQEEIFGPVLAIMPFDTPDEAVALANGTAYGLVAGIWTRDLSTAHRMAAELRVGQVFVNTYGAGGGVEMPFGGYKKSGFGREKGLETLQHYTQVKNVCVRYE